MPVWLQIAGAIASALLSPGKPPYTIAFSLQ